VWIPSSDLRFLGRLLSRIFREGVKDRLHHSPYCLRADDGSEGDITFGELRSAYILTNPPFNISDWGGDRLREDARWTYGAPPIGNANYGWLQHILWHLAPNGTAGVVLANGSMSSAQSGEDVIRKGMVEADVVDCISIGAHAG
jgi:type I restriction-modification system DNA methylase subunit